MGHSETKGGGAKYRRRQKRPRSPANGIVVCVCVCVCYPLTGECGGMLQTIGRWR